MSRPVAPSGRYQHVFVGGQWVAPEEGRTVEVISPATGEAIASVAVAGRTEVDRAVVAARAAFDREAWSIGSSSE